MSNVRLFLIHRNRLLRECLAAVLSGTSQYDVVEFEGTSAQIELEDEGSSPQIVLLDVNLPQGRAPELTKWLLANYSDVRILLLVSPDAKGRVVEGISAGAHGCVPEEASLEELREAIDKVLEGQTFCSPRIMEYMFAQFAALGSQLRLRQTDESSNLTTRETEILRLIAEGLGNKQIARRLSLSLYTVKNHVHNILEKLKVANRAQAVHFARDFHRLHGPEMGNRSSNVG